MKENLVFSKGFSFILIVLNSSHYYSMNGIENTKKEMPILKNDEIVFLFTR